MAEDIRPEIALREATLELEPPPENLEVLLNPKRLRRVFENLIHNATDAMPDGGRIFLRVRPNQKEVVTEIEDAGTGIAPEIAGQLFEAFATHGKAMEQDWACRFANGLLKIIMVGFLHAMNLTKGRYFPSDCPFHQKGY
jgi:K+-sensing histidine kinase KdpD